MLAVSPQAIAHSLRLHHLQARPDAIAALESVLRAEADPKRVLNRLCVALRDKASARSNNIVDCNLVSQLVAGSCVFVS